jgi:Omp85 superfamily domain
VTRPAPLCPFLVAAALASAALPRALAAQEAPAPAEPPTGAQACRDGTVSQIFVDNNSVFVVGDPELDPRFNWAYRLANQVHVPTRESVIRRELLFREGDCYRPERLEDSERILRATSFIADADVFAVRQGDGSHHVIVETRDEWSTRLEPQLESGAFTGVELREDNLMGRGHRVSAFVKEYEGERIFGAGVATRQFLGTHLDAELGVAKTTVGVSVTQRLAWPFRGEAGRFAFRQQFEHLARNFEFFVPREGGGLDRRLFEEERTSFEVGGVVRLGRRGNLSLFGAAVAGERIAYPRERLVPEEDTPLVGPGERVEGLDSVSNVRLVFLAGQRNVFFDRRRALDAVRGAEDVRLGVEAELGIGRSLTMFSDDDDVAVDFGFSAAGDLPGGILGGMRVLVEGKRDLAAGAERDWRDILGQVDAWAYWRPSPESRHTWVAAVRGVGGWETTVPFQVTLGNRAGLRGYDRHTHAGERRVVGTLEHRAYLGWPYPRLFDLGSAVFVDAGRTWAGEGAFGESSPLQASAGVGLRLAFPPGSRQTYRLDVAIPVAPDFRAGQVQISLGVGQAVGRGVVDDDRQLRRSSRRAVSASLFSYPN